MLTWLSIYPSPDIYCCGLLSTRKSDCTGLPQNMLVCGSTPAQRGQSRVMMKGTMSLISWYNKGHFRFLTNGYSPTKQGKQCSDARRTKTLKVCLSHWILVLTREGTICSGAQNACVYNWRKSQKCHNIEKVFLPLKIGLAVLLFLDATYRQVKLAHC